MTFLVLACFAAGTLLFVLSLPLGTSQVGRSLRRAAGVCFIAALAPSVACGLLSQALGRGGQPPSLTGFLAAVGFVSIVSVAAYLTLAVRGHLRRSRRRDQQGAQRRGYQYDEDPRGPWPDGRG